MYLKKNLLACWCFLLAHLSFSQDEFKEGFIIKSKDQFVYGYIRKSPSSENLICIFKESIESPAKEYSPEEIEGYGLLNESHFRAKEITINDQPVKRFLEAVADGPVVLYSGLNRIFIERDHSFYELKSDESKLASYRSILTSLLTDCKSVTSKIKDTKIELGLLTRLVKNYNECITTGVVPESERKSPAIHIEFLTGLDRTTVIMSGPAQIFKEQLNFTDRTLITGGINFIFFLKNLERLSIQSGAWFSDQRFYTSDKQTASNGVNQRDIIRINYQGLRIPLLFRINSTGKTLVQPYAKIGLLFPVSLKNSTTWEHESGATNSVYIDSNTFIETYNEPTLGHLSTGATFTISKKLKAFAEISYSFGKQSYAFVSPPQEIKGKFNILNIHTGLRIK
jgi:hypothetical protein